MGTNARQTQGGGFALYDDVTSSKVMEAGGTHRALIIKQLPIVGVVATTGGAILAWANPENVPIIIDRVEIDVITKSTGAANISVGTAANGTTSSANLIDTYAIGGTEKVVTNMDDKGTNGKSVQKMSLSQFLTITGSATTAGLVATVNVHYYTT